MVHFNRLKLCHNDVRLPQVLGPDKQLTHDLQQTSQPSISKPPIGTNVEIIDVLEPTKRYPLRASRQVPARYNFTDLEYRMYSYWRGIM